MSQQVSEPINIEEELQKLKGKSWFDVEQEHRQATGRKSVTRIIFTSLIEKELDDISCKTDTDTSINIALKIHDFFKPFNTKESSDSSDEEEVNQLHGGVVLAYNGSESADEGVVVTAALGFLEIDSLSIAHECLSKLGETNSIGLHSIRILLVSDDCPCNDFGIFGVYIARPPAEDHVDIEKEGPTIVFSAIMKNLCKQVMSFPTEAKEHEQNKILKVLSGQQRKSIPSVLRIESCAKSDEFPTLQEYLDIYHSPIYLELESEKMSPLLPVIDWKRVEEIASSSLPKQNT